MASEAEVHVRATVTDDADTVQIRFDSMSTIADVVGVNGKRETVSLTGNAFTTLTAPTGAVAVLINIIGAPDTSATLKGISGDTGIRLCSAAQPAVPVLVPLGATPSIGIAVASEDPASLTADIIWL